MPPPAQLAGIAGECGELIRTLDWANSPLGSPAEWPEPLLTAVSLMLSSRHPMFVAWGPELGFVYNDDYRPFLGPRHPAAMGSRFREVWADVWADIEGYARAALAGRSTFRDDLRLRMTHRGRPEDTWWTFSYSPLRDSSGAVAGLFCACHEITGDVQLRRLQQFRFELGERLRKLADPERVLATTCATLGELFAADRVGYSETEPDGRHVTIRTEWLRGAAAPLVGRRIAIADFDGRIVDALQAGRPVRIADARAPGGVIEPGARGQLEAIGVRATVTVPLVKDGRFAGALYVHAGAPREWTDEDVALVAEVGERTWDALVRARAETRLRESEERFRRIFEQANDFIFTADLEQRITSCNPSVATALGRRPEELVGRSIAEFIPREEFERTSTMLAQKLAGGGSTRYQVHVHGRDGSLMVWEINSRLLFGDDGRPVGLHAIGRDVTEAEHARVALRASELALREADRRKDEFLATLAHELRNPMAPIRYATAMLRRGAAPEVLEQARQMIERQSAQMSRLLDDLLDMSRITRNVIELKRETLDLTALLREAAETASPVVAAQQQRLELRLPDAPVHVDGDAMRLLQVVGNLLNNAAKYTEPGGVVTLELRADAREARIHVRDTGVGLAPEMLPRLFELFSQVHPTLKVAKGGLGIGLAVARRLVELHGGRIEARSDGLGRGAEFVVSLPLVEAAPAIPRSVRGGAQPRPSTAARVLIVDDNEDAARSLALLLDACGLEVELAHDGAAALERALAWRPAVIVLDVGLPKLSGEDVAREIRRHEWGRRVRIIGVTGWGQHEDRERTRAAGFDLHLVKPVDPEQLLELVREAAARDTG